MFDFAAVRQLAEVVGMLVVLRAVALPVAEERKTECLCRDTSVQGEEWRCHDLPFPSCSRPQSSHHH